MQLKFSLAVAADGTLKRPKAGIWADVLNTLLKLYDFSLVNAGEEVSSCLETFREAKGTD